MESREGYIRYATLELTGPALCISVTGNGKLACGGTGGTQIWRLPGLDEIPGPAGVGRRGATTALAWITKEDMSEDVLAYGTQGGDVVLWRERKEPEKTGKVCLEEISSVRLAEPSEITGLSFEPVSNRLAACNRNSVIQVFSVGLNMRLATVFSVSLPNYVPKSVAFKRIGHTHLVLTFGFYDGRMHSLRPDTGEVEATLETGGMIGSAQLDIRCSMLCIDDLYDGAALYHLDTGARVQTYHVPVSKSLRPRQVSFAENSSIVVVGSDHGTVYLFDRREGHVVEELSMGSQARVQAILAADVLGVPYVIGGKSQDGDKGQVVVWRKGVGPGLRRTGGLKRWAKGLNRRADDLNRWADSLNRWADCLSLQMEGLSQWAGGLEQWADGLSRRQFFLLAQFIMFSATVAFASQIFAAAIGRLNELRGLISA